MRADRYDRAVDAAASRHSHEAFALRQLERSLNHAGWESLYVDYQLQRTRLEPNEQISLSSMTQRLFKDAKNVGARRRRLMKTEIRLET